MHVFLYFFFLAQSILIMYPKVKKDSIILIIVIALLFAVFSANIETELLIDRRSYDFMFTSRFPRYVSIDEILDASIEPGFIFLNLAIYSYTQNPYWLYFLSTFAMVFINIYTIKEVSNKFKWATFYYLISLQVFWGTFIVRQGLAAAFINLAFLFFIFNKRKMSIVFTLIAVLFHSSAIIMLPLYGLLVIVKKIHPRNLWLIVAGALIIVIFYDLVLTNLFDIPFINNSYGGYDVISNQSNYASAIKGTPFYLIMIYSFIEYKKIIKTVNNAWIFYLFTIINSLFWILSIRMYWMWRFSMYTTIPTIIFMTYIFEVSDNKYKEFYRILIAVLIAFITIRELLITL